MGEPPFSKDQIAQAQAYAELMEQLRVRCNGFGQMLSPAFFGQHPEQIALESCYLQLRMIIEVIALGCLYAQGSTPGARSKWFRSETSADKIMEGLNRLNAEFYPIPERQLRDADNNWIGSDFLQDGFMKRKELTALYGLCGNELHIGSLNLQGRRARYPIEHHFKLFNESLAGIMNLMRWHTIITYDPAVQLWVNIQPADGPPPLVRLTRIQGPAGETMAQLAKARGLVDRHG